MLLICCRTFDLLVYVKQPPPLLRDKSFSEFYDVMTPIPPGKKNLKYFRNPSCDAGQFSDRKKTT